MSYASAAMCYEAIICPRCSSVSIVKNGKTAQRKQRYLCKDCRRQFIRDYTNLGCVGAVRDLVVPLTINGAGIRDIERVLFLSTNTILKTLLEAATLVDDPAYPRRVHDLEMDEFWSFVGAKRRQRWTWYGYDRRRRKVVAFVNERRTDAACRQLLQKLAGCRITRYHTDNWQSYAKFLPARRHRTGKEGTSRIERHNLNFRTRLKRLQRHTICYSKSAVVHDAVIKLYVHHSNADNHHF
jgi:insertion element IS1 protein InsB